MATTGLTLTEIRDRLVTLTRIRSEKSKELEEIDLQINLYLRQIDRLIDSDILTIESEPNNNS